MTIRRITMHQSAQRLVHACERGNTAIMNAPAPTAHVIDRISPPKKARAKKKTARRRR